MKKTADEIALHHAQELISLQSVTPHAEQAIAYCKEYLQACAFDCHLLHYGEDENKVANLVAMHGDKKPHLCFAGHLDTVPAGDLEAWQYPPFKATIHEGKLYGRGAEDMKGNVAAFMAAAEFFLYQNPAYKGRLSMLLTSDEEGPALYGTKPTIKWMHTNGYTPDHVIVGEPTAQASPGDAIKIGRRGSINTKVTVKGTQGHVAYPEKANSPMPAVLALCSKLNATVLDEGSTHFSASHLEITSIDTGNLATNVIPENVYIHFNIRYNDHHTGDSLAKWIKQICSEVENEFHVSINANSRNSGDSFYTQDAPYLKIITEVIKNTIQKEPVLSTGGGTSDARFIKNFCPVVEIGLPGKTMHKINEYIEIEHLNILTKLYLHIIEKYFFLN